jgi:hypothetical protein
VGIALVELSENRHLVCRRHEDVLLSEVGRLKLILGDVP